MAFTVMYYISIACPTIERSLAMIDWYVAQGADNFQIDMPSFDPYGETDFIKSMMENALKKNSNYDDYMDAFRAIRAKHPGIKLSVVVYKDVIDKIGIETFTAFCNEIGAYSVRQAGTDDRAENTAYMQAHGIYTVEGIGYAMHDAHIEPLVGKNNIVVMRTRRKTEAPNPGFETWEKRIGYVRDKGVTAPIYAIADMRTASDLKAAKAGGADGVIVGNVLMRLWDDESALLEKFNELQSVAE